MQPVQDLSIDTAVSATQYQFTLENQDLATLQEWTPRVLQRLGEIPSIVDVASDLQPNGRSVLVDLDRAQAARFGITPAIVDNALYDAYGQRIISTIFTQTNQYRVILDIDPKMARSLESSNSLYLPSAASTSGQTPLNSVGEFRRQDLAAADLAPQAVSGDDDFVQPRAGRFARRGGGRRSTRRWPTSICRRALPISYQGAAQAFQSALSNEVFLLGCGDCGDVYRSRRALRELHPSDHDTDHAAVGGHRRALTLNAAGAGLDIIGVIGIVLLIGIVKKNAIMMIDFALEAQRQQGMPPREAIYQACLLRLRPILMTTVAAIFGALPLMLGSGVGSELRHPLGLAIVGGLAFSQVLTLYTTPVIYLFFERLGERFGLGRGSRELAAEALVNNRFSEVFIRRPVATTLLTIGIDLRRSARLLAAAGLAAAAGRFPDRLRSGATCRARVPDTMATSGRRAARAPSRSDRRRQRNDVAEHARLDAHHAAVRPRPQHRRRGPRRPGGDRRRARRPADQPAAEPDLPQGQPRRRADHGHRHDVVDPHRGPALRSRLQHPPAAPVAAAGDRRGRRLGAPRCRRSASRSTRRRSSITASASRTSAPRSPPPTPTAPRARSRTTTLIIRSTPTTRRPRRRNIAIW